MAPYDADKVSAVIYSGQAPVLPNCPSTSLLPPLASPRFTCSSVVAEAQQLNLGPETVIRINRACFAALPSRGDCGY